MNYYPHHIGDYSRDTAHLSILEDGAYRRMLDLYYASERQLPKKRDALYRLVRARSKEEKLVVDTLLGEFFIETETGWRHERCEREILKAKEKSEKAAASAAMRWHKEPDANAMRTHSEGNAPNSQEPITKEKSNGASRLPATWEPSDSLKAWFSENRPDLSLSLTAANFRDHWQAASGARARKHDWDAAFRTWARNERGGGVQAQPRIKVDL